MTGGSAICKQDTKEECQCVEFVKADESLEDSPLPGDCNDAKKEDCEGRLEQNLFDQVENLTSEDHLCGGQRKPRWQDGFAHFCKRIRDCNDAMVEHSRSESNVHARVCGMNNLDESA